MLHGNAVTKAVAYNKAHWPPENDLPPHLRGMNPATTAAADAVAVWQQDHGLTVDGCLGPKTLASMRAVAVRAQWVEGVDVSGWQPAVLDWEAARRAGFRYAWIKATQDEGYNSPDYLSQVKGALAAGVLCSPYHFAVPERGDSPEFEADRLCDADGRFPFALRPVLDFEEAHQGKRKDDKPDPAYKLPAAFLAQWADAFVARVEERLGFAPIFYSYDYFIRERKAEFARYPRLVVRCPLWIARYGPYPPKSVAPWPRWHVWQWTQRGKVPGIPGGVDLNRCAAADLAALRRPGGAGGGGHA